jgi:dipeptidyl aminopeptidase/acylaminoacyl peptidase
LKDKRMQPQASCPNPLVPEDLFRLRFLRGADLSKDCRYIAYAVSRTDDEERFEIWVMDAKGGMPERLAYAGNATTPRWSPDGNWIAFVADGVLRVAAFPGLYVSEPITPEHLTVEGVPSWSPDGANIAISLRERHETQGPRQIRDAHYRADGVGYVADVSQQIYIVARSGGSARCITSRERVCSHAEWSPCGRRIMFLATDDVSPFSSASPRPFTIDVNSAELIEVLDGRWYVNAARWLPDGERIVVIGARDSTLTIPTLSLWVVDIRSGDAELRTNGVTGNVGMRMHHDMPSWDLTNDNTLVVADTRTAFASVQKGGSVEIWSVALEGETAVERIVSGARSCMVLGVNRANDYLLFAATDAHSPPDLYSLRVTNRCERRLSWLNAEVVSEWPQMDLKSFVFASADGTEIEAWFMGDPRLTPPLPTVLFIHGGPYIAIGHAFRFDTLLLASHGFGVAFANFRGSAGYGEPFVRAMKGSWGAAGFPDHMGTVDEAILRGLADPSRLGVWGPSHGGFATCWIVGHTGRFKAAIAEAAVTNFVTAYYLSDIPDAWQCEFGGKPHEIPDVYRACSPITYAHRSTTPMLLIHGEEDLRCPISEAEQFYRALKDVGCETELLRIPRCSHLGDSCGPLSARLAQNQALISWFKRYL